MINEFISKEEKYKKCLIESLEQGGYNYEEDKNIWDKLINSTKRNELLETDICFFKSKIIDTKLSIKFMFKNLDLLMKQKEIIIKNIEESKKYKDDKKINNLKSLLDETLLSIENNNCFILGKGQLLWLLFIPLIEKYFSFNEMCSILGSNPITCKKILSEVPEDLKADGIFENLISFKAELSPGRYIYNTQVFFYTMPFFYSTTFFLADQICNNPEMSEIYEDCMEDLIGEDLMSITYDEYGNIISLEKVYQAVTIKELINNYEGQYIEKLKKSKILNLFEIINIKKIDIDFYAVLDNKKMK